MHPVINGSDSRIRVDVVPVRFTHPRANEQVRVGYVEVIVPGTGQQECDRPTGTYRRHGTVSDPLGVLGTCLSRGQTEQV